ncbi:MAG: AmmeMemoRadiSam system protein A [Patescibacteria group bacterium]
MNPYSRLARQAVEEHFDTGKTLKPPADLPMELLEKKAGVFVTIYNQKELRGCIGTFLPTQKNIAQEIIANSISAATVDYRFQPISLEELPQLSYEISILTEPELVQSLKDLDPKKYGVIVRSRHRRSGLLLPDLDGVDTIEQQLSIAASKGGIDSDSDPIEIYRFMTIKYRNKDK